MLDCQKDVLIVAGMEGLKAVVSSRQCLYCLFYPSQHLLACQHGVCDGCVRKFAQPSADQDHSYLLYGCFLCRHTRMRFVQLKPPTAGVRLLSLDGGGIRGVIEIMILRAIADKFGAECNIRDLFDLAYGTSAGKFDVARSWKTANW